MDLFNPFTTLLLLIIIVKILIDLKDVKEERDELLGYILKEFGSGETDIKLPLSEEEDEFDTKIRQMQEELDSLSMGVNTMINVSPTVSEILDPRVYNLSDEEIKELEKQINPDEEEYSD